MKKLPLFERLMVALADHFAPYGFVRRKGEYKHKLVRQYDWGNNSITILSAMYAYCFSVTAHIEIRFDAVEAVKWRFNDTKTPKAKKEVASLGDELGKFQGIGWDPKTIAGEEDIEKVADEIFCGVQKSAIPLIEKYSNIHDALELLCSDDPVADILSSGDTHRGMTSIAMAWLLRDADRVRKLISKYMAIFEESYRIDVTNPPGPPFPLNEVIECGQFKGMIQGEWNPSVNCAQSLGTLRQFQRFVASIEEQTKERHDAELQQVSGASLTKPRRIRKQ